MSEKPVRVLPADVYDTLELSAYAYGGVGGFWMWDYRYAPCCILGHAVFAVPPMKENPVVGALDRLHFSANLIAANDRAVRSVNTRKGRKRPNARVPFADWCAELGVVRGE